MDREALRERPFLGVGDGRDPVEHVVVVADERDERLPGPRMALAAQMQNAAGIASARTGDPNHSDLPQWDPYSLDERTTMIFDAPAAR